MARLSASLKVDGLRIASIDIPFTAQLDYSPVPDYSDSYSPVVYHFMTMLDDDIMDDDHFEMVNAELELLCRIVIEIFLLVEEPLRKTKQIKVKDLDGNTHRICITIWIKD